MANVTEGSGIQGTPYAGSTGTNIETREVSPQPSGVSGIAAQGREQIKRFSGVARDIVYHRADTRKGTLVKSLQGVISKLEDASNDSEGMVRQVLDSTIGYVRRFSDRLEHGSSEELLEEAKEKVRERPAAFFVGCLAVGFLAARVLKA